jgi:hypothetical protein
VAEAGQAVAHTLMARAGEVGRLGGGVTEALMNWFVETWLYTIVLAIAYGAVVGYGACKIIKLALKQYVSSHLTLTQTNVFIANLSTTSPTSSSPWPSASSSSAAVVPSEPTISSPASSPA